jgi:excisionase family DNA binding protein
MDKYLTTKEISKLLKVNLLTVRRWITSGKLIAIDLGKEYRVERKDFEAFITKRKVKK